MLFLNEFLRLSEDTKRYFILTGPKKAFGELAYGLIAARLSGLSGEFGTVCIIVL